MVFCIEICWRTALCKEGSGCGQLEQEPDGQGALMKAGSATSHVVHLATQERSISSPHSNRSGIQYHQLSKILFFEESISVQSL